MKKLILAAMLGLAACGSVQEDVENSGYVCKDNVEYFVYEKYSGGNYSYSVVPHFKPDGSLYTCIMPERKKK